MKLLTLIVSMISMCTARVHIHENNSPTFTVGMPSSGAAGKHLPRPENIDSHIGKRWCHL
jgi:hypothetical protein